jgi:hypothetical protein
VKVKSIVVKITSGIGITSLKSALRRLLMRPGKYNELQHWQGESDHGPSPPISLDQFMQSLHLDPNKPLKDLVDGWKWRSYQVGTCRTWYRKEKKVRDESGTDQSFVSLPCGLVFQLLLDWYVILHTSILLTQILRLRFQASNRVSSSTGAVFLTIDNLPRSICYLRENTFLVLLIPGPHEPTMSGSMCTKNIHRAV